MTQEALQDLSKTLEEKVEFSNVTDVRKDFLPRIEEIQKNPALRLLILKHGKPQAVLMSAEAYDVLKKVVDLFLQHVSGLSREQTIAAAIKRFESSTLFHSRQGRKHGRSGLPATDEGFWR